MSARRRYESNPSFADLFTTQEDRDEAKLEKVQMLPLGELNLALMEAMNWWLVTGANGRVSWRAFRKCRYWSEKWTMIPPLS